MVRASRIRRLKERNEAHQILNNFLNIYWKFSEPIFNGKETFYRYLDADIDITVRGVGSKRITITYKRSKTMKEAIKAAFSASELGVAIDASHSESWRPIIYVSQTVSMEEFAIQLLAKDIEK